MKVWRNHTIKDKHHKVLVHLYDFRGLTNELLRQLIFGHLQSDQAGQKANISRYISELRSMKLIDSASCFPYSKELIHFLTPKGIEYVKEHVTINTGDPGAGFNDVHGDFDYSMLKPPLQNLEHYMMYLKTAVRYRIKYAFRHNLYGVKEYKYSVPYGKGVIEKKGKVRADGELLTTSKHILSVEADTGSERFEALKAKFENYKRMIDYHVQNDLPLPWSGVIFITKQGKLPLNKDIRWRTILRAACEGLSYYCWSFPVIGFEKGKPLSMLLKENLDALKELNIPIPPSVNPILKKKQEAEERKRKEEEQKRQLELKRQEDLKRKQAEAKRQQEEKAREELRKKQEEEQQQKKPFWKW